MCLLRSGSKSTGKGLRVSLVAFSLLLLVLLPLCAEKVYTMTETEMQELIANSEELSKTIVRQEASLNEQAKYITSLETVINRQNSLLGISSELDKMLLQIQQEQKSLIAEIETSFKEYETGVRLKLAGLITLAVLEAIGLGISLFYNIVH